jgi:hypothetical protein
MQVFPPPCSLLAAAAIPSPARNLAESDGEDNRGVELPSVHKAMGKLCLQFFLKYWVVHVLTMVLIDTLMVLKLH